MKYTNDFFDFFQGSGFINTLRPRPNRCHFADNIFKCIFLNENVWISIDISLKFVPKGPIDQIPALVQIMAWHRPGDKPLSEPMMISLLTHICVTRPQWVKQYITHKLSVHQILPKISMLQDVAFNVIALKFDGFLSSSAVEQPATFQSGIWSC